MTGGGWKGRSQRCSDTAHSFGYQFCDLGAGCQRLPDSPEDSSTSRQQQRQGGTAPATMQSTLITAAGCQVSPFHRPACMRQQQRLAPLPHRPQQQQQPIVLVPSGGSNNSKAVILRATKPDRGSLAALEAAVGAINGILGAHSNRQKQKQQKQQKQKGPPGSAAPPPAQAGPSKLISFSAKASSSVPVKVSRGSELCSFCDCTAASMQVKQVSAAVHRSCKHADLVPEHSLAR
jgi:hypothetical protein